MLDKIVIKGAREHNLKGIDLEIPKNRLVVFTGISGSGKSSLVFDTIFAEGQRRYMESLSSYARQFLGQMEKPSVDHIEGLSPAIAIDQKSASHNPRSTVGTITEIYDYLRLMFAKVGVPHCLNCGKPIKSTTVEEMIDYILDIVIAQTSSTPEVKEVHTSGVMGKTVVQILSPIVRGKKGEYSDAINNIYHSGYAKARIDGIITDISEKISLSRYKMHNIEVLVDELEVNSDNLSRLTESLETAAGLSKGFVTVVEVENKKESNYSQNLTCADCELSFPEIEPRLFSFNSPYGACEQCNGLGVKHEIDKHLVLPDYNKTVSEGAFLPYSYKETNFYGTILRAAMSERGLDPQRRLKDWKKEDVNYILYGDNNSSTKIKIYSPGRKYSFYMNFNGIIPWLSKRYLETDSDLVRKDLEKYFAEEVCDTCGGKRLKPEALNVKIGDKNISEITHLTISDALDFFVNLKLNSRQMIIAEKILKEIKNRLNFLIDVGLNYLTLDRTGSTLAGGEAQRIRLASQIGSALTGVLYVLDEPSIGLHARDQEKLIGILKKLRDLGNNVLVVEHDEQTMRNADWLTDIGPGAGKNGGEVVHNGDYASLLKNEKSITGQYLSGKLKIEIPLKRRKAKSGFVTIKGATENNLKNVIAHFPIGLFTCVTGVSGSGKSSLVVDVLYKALNKKVNRTLTKPGKHHSIEGTENIKKVVLIDQSPIGRTPRSNPATYTGVFTHIRDLFTQTLDAKSRGYGPGRFSFNVAQGRCQTCSGEGFLKIEMQFLPDVYLPCDVCGGKRYNKETLSVKYKGKNIAEVLKMSVSEALVFFANIPKIADILKILNDVGLGYIELGQAATTLSGGEAQRIKLASELSLRQNGKSFYILDEPTTGLHFDDIKKLLDVLNRLVNAGNTVVVIEHNLDVIKVADNIIDMGPEGGEGGGKIIANGAPEDIAKSPNSETARFLKEVLKN